MSRHVSATVAVVAIRLLVLGPPVQAQDTPSTQELADVRARAESGEADVQFILGWMYDTGEGVPEDDAEAVAWYRKAAEQDIAVAQYNLGWMYATGVGVPLDDAAAVAWYRKAAEQGHADAQYFLGVMYAEGRGVSQDDAEAVAWYRKAAEQGHTYGPRRRAVLPRGHVRRGPWRLAG